MEFTGERFIPKDVSKESYKIIYEHLHRYAYISNVVSNKKVLDIACGSGYGSAELSKSAENVVGVDIDVEAVEFAKSTYSDINNLSFFQGSVINIPFEDNSFDIVVSFETIEHLHEQKKMILEIKRVLKEDGILVISTPDKKIYTDESGEINEFHVKELYRNEFEELLSKHFKNTAIFGQRFITSSSIQPLDCEPVSITGEWSIPTNNSVYLIAICSDSALYENYSGSIYSKSDMDIYSHDLERLRWASSNHHALEKSQRDYFELEKRYNDLDDKYNKVTNSYLFKMIAKARRIIKFK